MRLSVLAVLFLLLAAGGTPAMAGPPGARDHVRSGEVMPLDRILPQIRREHPGRFYDAEGPFPDGRGGMHYRLKWLTPEGRVIWLDTDARTGRVVGRGRNADHYRGRNQAPAQSGRGKNWRDRDHGRPDYNRQNQKRPHQKQPQRERFERGNVPDWGATRNRNPQWKGGGRGHYNNGGHGHYNNGGHGRHDGGGGHRGHW